MRPVINLKPLNQYIQNIHFKMENIQMALNLISPGDFMVSLDLKNAYFNIPIFSLHRKYLRFIWKVSVVNLPVCHLATALLLEFLLKCLSLSYRILDYLA